jgi:iron complex outermembrane receptor protein
MSKSKAVFCVKNSFAKAGLVAAVAAAGLTLAGQATAQLVLEEVVVTAQKRTESLVDVPISIAAVSAETLQQISIRELGELAEYIPNLQISGQTSYTTTITIRGVGSSSRNIGYDSRVGVYVDGVYTGQSPASNQDILDLERVEILRGPQGTLFGKNNVAGAINMITKKPEQEFGGELRGDFGNMNSRRLTGLLNVPLGDKVFTKISLNDQVRDGYLTSVYTGEDNIGEQDSSSARFQLLANLTDNLEMNFSADWSESDELRPIQRTIGTDAGLFEEVPGEFKTLNNIDATSERELKGGALTFDWGLDSGYTFKSITGYRETYHQTFSDLDGGHPWAGVNLPAPLPPVSVEFAFGITSEVMLDYSETYKQWTQEFQFLSPTDKDLQYVLGLYYYDQEGESNRDAIGDYDPENALLDPYPGDNWYAILTSGTVDTTAYAAYFNGTYQLGDNWTLGFGGRYTDEEKDADYNMDASLSAPDLFGQGLTINALFTFPTDHFVESRNDSYFAPEASVRYALNDETNIYYRLATGFKSGGFNLDFITQAALEAGLEFDKEEVLSHEIGIKGEAWERRLTYGASIFYSAFDDYQVQQFLEQDDAVAGAAVIGNASEVETMGLEIELSALLTTNLRMDAAFGYLDATYKDFPGGDKDENGEAINLKGYRLPGAPEYSVNLSLQYYLPVDALSAETLFRIDYAYATDIYGGGNNKEEEERVLEDGNSINYLYQDDVTRVNARIQMTASEDTWSVALWGRNLTDENDATNGKDIFGAYGSFQSLPRTYGIELGYKF